MKIALNLRQNDEMALGADQEKALERDVLACKRSDWEAKARLVHTFMPLLTSLARKRSSDIATTNRHIEAGKEGLLIACRKYRPEIDGKFQIFALTFIEAQMDRVGKSRNFFARLFGGG